MLMNRWRRTGLVLQCSVWSAKSRIVHKHGWRTLLDTIAYAVLVPGDGLRIEVREARLE
jgi:hypothetical protein